MKLSTTFPLILILIVSGARGERSLFGCLSVISKISLSAKEMVDQAKGLSFYSALSKAKEIGTAIYSMQDECAINFTQLSRSPQFINCTSDLSQLSQLTGDILKNIKTLEIEKVKDHIKAFVGQSTSALENCLHASMGLNFPKGVNSGDSKDQKNADLSMQSQIMLAVAQHLLGDERIKSISNLKELILQSSVLKLNNGCALKSVSLLAQIATLTLEISNLRIHSAIASAIELKDKSKIFYTECLSHMNGKIASQNQEEGEKQLLGQQESDQEEFKMFSQSNFDFEYNIRLLVSGVFEYVQDFVQDNSVCVEDLTTVVSQSAELIQDFVKSGGENASTKIDQFLSKINKAKEECESRKKLDKLQEQE